MLNSKGSKRAETMVRRLHLWSCLIATSLVLAACDWSIQSHPTGRFQIFYSPHGARDTFLLDTQTGRVWQLTSFSYLDGEPVAWDLMTRIDNKEDFQRFIQEHSKVPTDPLALPKKP
jgi:hypothetical protein